MVWACAVFRLSAGVCVAELPCLPSIVSVACFDAPERRGIALSLPLAGGRTLAPASVWRGGVNGISGSGALADGAGVTRWGYVSCLRWMGTCLSSVLPFCGLGWRWRTPFTFLPACLPSREEGLREKERRRKGLPFPGPLYVSCLCLCLHGMCRICLLSS